MSDARSLLKAKRLERGAVAKPTRGAPVRTKADEQLRKGKRKLENQLSADVAQIALSDPPTEKRRRVEEPESDSTGAFPSDFFSDSSRTLPVADDDDVAAQNNESLPNPQPQPTTSSSSSQTKSVVPAPSVDDEYEAFQRAMQAAAKPTPRDVQVDAYSRATVAAEPVLLMESSSGFPPSVGADDTADQTDAQAEEDETEIDRTRRQLQEERELVLDRLMDEERAQEDADAKVTALKARLEAIKQKRAARKAGS